jgi:hypothetical protein
MAKIKNSDNSKHWQGAKKVDYSYTAGKEIKLYNHFEKVWQFLKNLNIHLL